MIPSRFSRGHARFVAASALLVVLAAVSACSAGQIAQTASQVPAVPGANVDAGANGEIALRNLVVAYNDPRGYPQGGSAPLVVRIFNGGHTPVTLVGVSATTDAESVSLADGSTPPDATPSGPPASPTLAASPTAGASPTTGPGPSPGTEPGGSPTPSPAPPPSPQQPSPSPAGTDGTASLSMRIAPSSYLLLVPGQGPYLRLVGLKQALTPGSSVQVTFIFAEAITVTVTVPFGMPTAPVPRTSADVPDEASE